MNLDRDSGVFFGIPNETGTFIVIFTVIDDDNHMAIKPFQFNISQSLQIINNDFPDAFIESEYSELVAFQGGLFPYTFNISSYIPSELEFDTVTGLLSGIPYGPVESVLLEITVTDDSFPEPQTDKEHILIHIANKLKVKITKRSLIDSVPVNIPLSKDIVFNTDSENSPFTWEIISGGIPRGTEFETQENLNGAAISGQPRETGTFMFEIKVTDKNGDSYQKKFYWTIHDELKLIPRSIPEFQVGIQIDPIVFEASGGVSPYVWNMSNLPNGLTFDPETHAIIGTPETQPVIPSIIMSNISVRDSYLPAIQEVSKNIILIVRNDDLKVFPSELPDTKVNYSYKANIWAKSDAPPYQFELLSATPKPEFSIDIDNQCITISGKESNPGVYNLRFKISDSSTRAPVKKDYTITVYDIASIVTNELITAEKEQPYSETILVDGIYPPCNFQLVSGSLPSGLSLDHETGSISGIVGADAKTSDFTIKVTKEGTFGSFDQKEFTIYVSGAPLKITTSFILPFKYNKYRESTIKAAGGLKTYEWFLTKGVLPYGLNLSQDNNNYLISGAPSQCGEFNIHVKVKDNNSDFDSKLFKLEVRCDSFDNTPPDMPVLVKSFPLTQTQCTGKVRVFIRQPQEDTDVIGYSYVWNQSRSFEPDTSIETNKTEIVSPQLAEGNRHYVHISAINKFQIASEPLSMGPFFVSRPSTRVIIVVGGEYDEDDPYWMATETLTQNAYLDFYEMGYSHEQIYYLINAKNGIDFDQDGIPDDIVDEDFEGDGVTSAADLLFNAISSINCDTGQPLYIFMQGHAYENGNFRIKGVDDDFVTAEALNTKLTDLQTRTGCKVVLIIESCFSGNLISHLAHSNRIIITSTGNNRYNSDINNIQVFSRYLFSKLRESVNLKDAFIFARNSMSDIGYPLPLIDDNGDAKSDVTDGSEAKKITPCLYLTWADKPVINHVSFNTLVNDPQALSVTVKITPGDVNTDLITGAIVFSYSDITRDSDTPVFKEFTLNKQSENCFANIINNLPIDSSYRFVFYAKNTLNELSDPKIITMNQKIPLIEGWNLFSFSVNKVFYFSENPPDLPFLSNVEYSKVESLDDVLQGIQGKYEFIKNFDKNGIQIYDPSVSPIDFNSLKYLAAGYGYWIKMIEPATLFLKGRLADPSEKLPLRKGWNLIGCWHSHVQHDSEIPFTIDAPKHFVTQFKDIFYSIDGAYEIIRNHDRNGVDTFDPSPEIPDGFNSLQYISPGYGYWIKMTEDKLFYYK